MYPRFQSAFLRWARAWNTTFDDDTLIEAYLEAVQIFYTNVVTGKLIELNAPVENYLIGIGKNLLMRKAQNAKMNIAIDDIPEKNPHLDKDILTLIIEEEYDEERKRKLRLAFAELGAKCQQLLKLFYYENFKSTDIKDIMAYKDENNVYASKARCLAQLRDIILKLK
jgi:DNA-directed RNA polymerase specialized sigma24 family protein